MEASLLPHLDSELSSRTPSSSDNAATLKIFEAALETPREILVIYTNRSGNIKDSVVLSG